MIACLQDICHLITDGKHGDCQNEEGSGYYFISCKDVKDGWIDYSGARQITEADYRDTHKRTQLEPNDILITNSGTIGRMALVPSKPETDRTTFQKSVAIIKPNSAYAAPQWLYYCLKATKDELIAWAGGTAQKNLLLRDLRAFKVQVPPLPTQHKIAGILSAYDDLIENNTRRMKILEEMAQRIYREWFVHFRYPGHEKDKLVDSRTELGMIPEGWEVEKLSKLVGTQYGYTESASGDKIGPKFVRGTDINKTSYIKWDAVPYCRIESAEYPKYKLQPGDIVVIRMADPGKAGIIEKEIEAVFASYLIRFGIRSRSLSPYYLFYFLMSERYQNYASGASTGTTRKSASAGVLTDIDILIPNDNIREQFEGQITALRQMLTNLLEKNANLRKTRDLLLPKLISGEIDVSELDIETGGSNP